LAPRNWSFVRGSCAASPRIFTEHQLGIDWLRLLRNHAAALLDFVSEYRIDDIGCGTGYDRHAANASSTEHLRPGSQSRNDDDLLTTHELADLLGLSKSRVQHNTSAKSIPHIRIGQTVRIRRGDIKAWILKQRLDPI
jgi:excisionase family DNA binding protein